MKLYRRRKINLILSLLLSFIIYSSNAQTNPGLSFGGSFDDKGLAMCLSGDGGYMLAGSTRSFGEGSEDIYLIKVNAYGQPVWSTTYGGLHHDFARSITSTEDGFMICGDVWDGGNTGLGMYMGSFDNEGNELWSKQFGTGMNDWGFSITETHDGNFVLLGYSRGFEPSGDIYIVKTDHQGNLLWENNYGYNYDDYAMDIVENTDGSLIIIGTKNGFFNDVHVNYVTHDADIMLLKIDTDGNELWKKTFGEDGHDFGYAIEKAQDGGNYIFGSTQSYGEGSFDMFLAKTDGEGNEEWHKTYGGELYEYGVSMDVNENGNLFLLGTTRSYGQNNSEDFYLIKVDEQGNNIWELTIGGEFADFGNSVIAMPDSGCVVVGSSKSFGSGGYDILFVKVDKYGQIENLVSNVDSAFEDKLIIAPNPVRGKGKILLSANNVNASRLFEITSMSGAIVKKYTINDFDLSFDVSSLPAGIYTYKLHESTSSLKTYTGKLIVY